MERKAGGDRDSSTTTCLPCRRTPFTLSGGRSTEFFRWARTSLKYGIVIAAHRHSKKMIFRTVIEEVIACTDPREKTLHFTIHWKGGVHTQLEMDRPRSATETATPMEALEIIRRMAVRHGDDQIASVLNRLGYSTGKGNRWNQNRVADRA